MIIEPVVRETSTPDAMIEPPVRETSTPDAMIEPPVREISRPAVVVANEAVDPLADTGPRPPAEDPEPGPPQVVSGEHKPPELKSSLLGARDEDSVLFSRDQLDDLVQSLGYGPGDDESEQSLVDIKPLADESLGISATGEGDDLVPLPVMSPAANIMFPSEETTKRKSLVGILLMSFAGIILAFGLLVGVLYLVSPNLMHAILEGKLDQQMAGKALEPGTSTTKSEAPVSPGAPPPVGVKEVGSPGPATEQPSTRVAAVGSGQPKRPYRKGPRRKRRGKKPSVAAVDPTATRSPIKAAPPVKTPPTRTAPVTLPGTKPAQKGGDELDRLIDGALEGKAPKAPPKKKPPVAKVAPAPRGNPISREVFNLAMGMAEDGVNACGKRFGKTGVVTIKITISGATGRITRGRALGSTAGTPVGACVVSAAKKSARFPKFGGTSRTMDYAYILR